MFPSPPRRSSDLSDSTGEKASYCSECFAGEKAGRRADSNNSTPLQSSRDMVRAGAPGLLLEGKEPYEADSCFLRKVDKLAYFSSQAVLAYLWGLLV